MSTRRIASESNLKAAGLARHFRGDCTCKLVVQQKTTSRAVAKVQDQAIAAAADTLVLLHSMVGETVSVARGMLGKCSDGTFNTAADMRQSVAAASEAAALYAKIHDLMPQGSAPAANQSIHFHNATAADVAALVAASKAILAERGESA
jgi:hypothetical protein